MAQRVHGGISPEQRAQGFLDLSVCVCPFGVPQKVREAIFEAPLETYPEPTSRAARTALAQHCRVSAEQVTLGHGAAELLWTLARVLVPGKRLLIWRPSFSEFENAARASGASIHYFDEVLEESTSIWSEAGGRTLRQTLDGGYAAVYLCAPASPLGTYVAFADCLALALEYPRTTFVVDQSYLGLSRHASELQLLGNCLPHAVAGSLPANLVLVRSLTKELSTPGLRIGYALLHPDLARAVASERAYWAVSSAAEAAAVAYTACTEELTRSRTTWLTLNRELSQRLEELGCSVFPSDTVYCTARVPERFQSAAQLVQLLAQDGIAVRDCASFGLPRCFRVAAHPEQARLFRALQAAFAAS